MEFFGAFTIKHGKVIRLIVSFIKLGFLNALVSDEKVGESIPSFLGGGDGSNKCLVLLGERHVDEVQGEGIELLVDEWWLGVDDVNDRPVGNPKRRCDEYSSKFPLSHETKV
jgi:hypothetical protein